MANRAIQAEVEIEKLLKTPCRRSRVSKRITELIDTDVETFAAKVGIDATTVAKYIIGVADITCEDAAKIAKTCDTGFTYLLGLGFGKGEWDDNYPSEQDHAEYAVMYNFYQKYTAAPKSVRNAVDSLLNI